MSSKKPVSDAMVEAVNRVADALERMKPAPQFVTSAWDDPNVQSVMKKVEGAKPGQVIAVTPEELLALGKLHRVQ